MHDVQQIDELCRTCFVPESGIEENKHARSMRTTCRDNRI